MEVNEPLVSVVIVNWNGKHFLKTCLDSLFKSDYKTLEVIVLDCASKDTSVEFIKANYHTVKLIEFDEDPGFDTANNIGCDEANGEYILMLNNDVILPRDTIFKLVNELKRDETCVVCPTEFNWGGMFTCKGNYPNWLGECIFKIFGPLFDLFKLKVDEPFYVGIACCLIKKDLFLKYPINEKFVMYEDIEWGWRLSLNKIKLKVLGNARFYHKSGGTLARSPKQAYIAGRSITAAHYVCSAKKSLLTVMPVLIIVYSIRYIGIYIIYYKDIKCATAFIKGIIKFLTEISEWRIEREKVQGHRLVSEKDILKRYFLSYYYVCHHKTIE